MNFWHMKTNNSINLGTDHW